MQATRLLVWLVSLVALLVPPVAVGQAMAMPRSVVSIDCPDHAPPPMPCPEHGTARHAAGVCCPLMTPMVALLSEAPIIDTKISFRMPTPELSAGMSGRIVTKDPPPPRV
jgi:hypothetical protein